MDPRFHVALLAPEIHWNTGNAGRTCLAAGAMLHVIEPLGFSLDAKQVRRAGLDYWERVPLRVWGSWSEFEVALESLGEPFFVTPEAETTIWDVVYPEPSVFVFGSETKGLPLELRRRYRDRLVSLPMKDTSLRSLNLSTAVGIVLYEALRQRRMST